MNRLSAIAVEDRPAALRGETVSLPRVTSAWGAADELILASLHENEARAKRAAGSART